MTAKWNEEAAPNNNLASETIQTSNLVGKQKTHAFAEKPADTEERNHMIQRDALNNIK